MNIRELENMTGCTARQVRFLIAEGFLHAPRGSRSQPEYGDDHVEAIKRYQRLRAADLTPKMIKLLMFPVANEGLSLTIAQGVTLCVEPSLVSSDLNPRLVGERVADILADLSVKSNSPQK